MCVTEEGDELIMTGSRGQPPRDVIGQRCRRRREVTGQQSVDTDTVSEVDNTELSRDKNGVGVLNRRLVLPYIRHGRADGSGNGIRSSASLSVVKLHNLTTAAAAVTVTVK